MKIIYRCALVALVVAASRLPCQAQPTQPTIFNPAGKPDPAAAPPSPAALALARTLVAKSSSDDIASLLFLYPPMARFLRIVGMLDVDRSMIVIREAMFPVLKQHRAEIDELQAQTYASKLTMDDMKAAIAFYETPAGVDYVRMRSPLLKLDSAGVNQLLATLMPQIETKAKEVMKAHGWTKG
jgi:hypothetical protein